MASQIAEVRMKPFVILAITDAQRESFLSESKLLEITKKLEDMSLRFAQTYSSTVYVDEIESACKSVLGIVNLGLMYESNQDLDKAKILLLQRSMMDFFRIGWTKVQELEKINPEINQAVYHNFSLEANESVNSVKLYSDLRDDYLQRTAMIRLNRLFVKQYYPNMDDDFLDLDNNSNTFLDIPTGVSSTVIIKLLLGTLLEPKGKLNKQELLSFVQLTFENSKEELEELMYNNINILSFIEKLPADLKKSFQECLVHFINYQKYPIDEIYNMKKANPNYSIKAIAFTLTGTIVDVQENVGADLASELSSKELKFLNLDDDIILE